jgi:hypothetical protein
MLPVHETEVIPSSCSPRWPACPLSSLIHLACSVEPCSLSLSAKRFRASYSSISL